MTVNPGRAKLIALVALLIAALEFLSVAAHARPKRAAASTETASVPTYYRDVAPILERHCEICHRADGIAPMALQTYGQTKTYAAAIATSTKSKSMPPWFAVPGIGHFSNDPSLSSNQIATLVAWAAADAPEGDAKDAPPPAHWAESWTIPEPDEIVAMSKGVAIPTDGDVDYTYEIVPA